jgi:membrane-associated phospholipid phosphatase
MLAALYPPFVLLVVVATGNHFFFDAAAGTLVAATAAVAAARLTQPSAATPITALSTASERLVPYEEQAA